MAKLTQDESTDLVNRIRSESTGWQLPGTPAIKVGRRKASDGTYQVWMVLKYEGNVEWSKYSWNTTLRLATIAEESWITSAGGGLVRYRIGKLF